MKALFVKLLLIVFTTITMITIYYENQSAVGIDIGVIASMSVGGMFVFLGAQLNKYKGEQKG
ncbi:hypothetical protein [Guptibacillus sedimenti]|uniref:hypothetical protein n=1 Tax=Guptibacillus sedimenti TaxID=3025680 RepID=UPI0023601AA0|nr:hypothetical protein [Pseudalkalibacillus sedimenti]